MEIGTDIESISRIEAVIKRTPRFVERCFTKNEIAYCENKGKGRFESYAARFCAKEAFSKAIGKPLNWHDVEIINNEDNKPQIFTYNKANELLNKRQIKLSLSHANDMAIAFVVIGHL